MKRCVKHETLYLYTCLDCSQERNNAVDSAAEKQRRIEYINKHFGQPLGDSPMRPISPVTGEIVYRAPAQVEGRFTYHIEWEEPEADPMERAVDGLTVRECLDIFQRMQREDTTTRRASYRPLNDAQIDAARSAWSASLKRMQSERREKERVSVVVERDEDGL